MCNETHITCRTRASYSGETTPLQVSVALFKPTGEALSIPAEKFFRGCKIPVSEISVDVLTTKCSKFIQNR